MSRVCSMESKATLPILVGRAGTRVAKTKFRRSWKGKDRGTFGKKAPGLHTYLRYLLEEPPREPAQSCHPTKATWENCSINVKIRSSTGYLTLPLPIRAYNTAKKVPPQPQPETSFCPTTNLPRNTRRSEKYIT